MHSHQERVELLSHALRVTPEQVVPSLRRRDVLYFGPGGALLFACGADWPDERLVEAALHVFVLDDHGPDQPASLILERAAVATSP